MSKIIPFKTIIPKEFQDNDYWDINDTIIIQKDDRFRFQKRSKYRWIDFSILDDENIKNEMKHYLWYALGNECLEMTVKYFKDKFLSTFISLLETIKDNGIQNTLLNIEFRHFKDKLSSNTREPLIFRKIQLFLLKNKPFEKENDAWDIFNTPMNENGRLHEFETSEARIINFSIIENESMKLELKNYLYSYVTNDFKEFDPQTNIINHLLPFQSILRCLQDENEITVLNINIEDLKPKFEKDGKSDIDFYLSMFGRIKNFVIGKEHLDFFERDMWNLRSLNLSEDRMNKTRPKHTLSFSDVKNDENKRLLKLFIKHLLLNSQFAVSTISSKQNRLKNLLVQLKDKYLKNISMNDKEMVLSLIPNNNSKQATISDIGKFFVYLAREKEIDFSIGKNFITQEDFKKKEVKMKDRYVEKETINELFNALDELDDDYQYLNTIINILVFTGLRISEICNLKLNCVYTSQRNTKRLRYESIKMRKEIDIPITEHVYKKIIEQQSSTLKKQGENKVYLFPSNGTSRSKKTKNKPINNLSVSKSFKRFCEEKDVKDIGGNLYNFKAHDFRHTFATHLIENNVSIEVIKELLGHETPQMTLAYLDKKEQREKKSIEKEISEKGIYNQTSSIIGENKAIVLQDEENIDAIYLKKHLNYQTLPNGTCSLPINKECPHPNACLSCKSFITTIDSLEQFKHQLKRTEKMIEFSKKNGFEQQLKTNLETKEKLEYFIKELENGKEVVKAKPE